jgi:hypothetical protein
VSPVNVTHGAVLDASQVQSRFVATESVPFPPAAATVPSGVVTLTWHFEEVGAVTERSAELHAALAQARALATNI